MNSILKLKFKWTYLLILFGVLVAATIVVDLFRISTYKTYPQRPEKNIQTRQNQIYWNLANGKNDIDWSSLDGTLEYINGQYDCSDFDLAYPIVLLFLFSNRIKKLSKIPISSE